MRIPDRLVSLIDEGIVEAVVRPLMSGKEAQVYLVVAGGEQCVAKVYKEAHDRTFKQRAQYTEGRTTRNTRDQRAIAKRTRHGREQDEAAWRAAEVDVIYRLRAAGVSVPKPHQFIDGVLIMELITDADGQPAPRLGDVSLDRDQAQAVFDQLLADVIKMLCSGVVHGDLSTFNVLMGSAGPVIIDFPQAVNPASNQNARKLLLRDVDNLQHFLRTFAPQRALLPYAQEMWDLYERSELTPETRLRGQFHVARREVDTRAVLELISDAERDALQRQAREQGPAKRPPNRRVEVIVPPSARRNPQGQARKPGSGRPEPIVQARRDSPPPARGELRPQQQRRDRNGHVPRDSHALQSRAPQHVEPRRGTGPLQPPAANAADARRGPSGAQSRVTDGMDARRDPAALARQPHPATGSNAGDPVVVPAQRKRRRRRRRGKPGNAGASASGAADSSPTQQPSTGGAATGRAAGTTGSMPQNTSGPPTGRPRTPTR